MEESHYLNEKIDDSFSEKAFNLYLKRMDFSKRFFTKSDVEDLSQYKLDIDNPELDEKMAEILEDENLDEDQQKKLAYLFKKNYPILTAEPRLDSIAKDLVWHFNERGYQGKAMYVAIDKPTAVRMYDLIQKYWPQYL